METRGKKQMGPRAMRALAKPRRQSQQPEASAPPSSQQLAHSPSPIPSHSPDPSPSQAVVLPDSAVVSKYNHNVTKKRPPKMMKGSSQLRQSKTPSRKKASPQYNVGDIRITTNANALSPTMSPN